MGDWGSDVFFFSSRRRHTRLVRDWSSDVCSSDLTTVGVPVTVKDNIVDIKLSIPVCAPVGQRIALSRQVDGKWHLIGYGIIN